MPGIDRRRFFNLVGPEWRRGRALHSTLGAMGIAAPPIPYRALTRLPKDSGRGIRIAVLGAGIAGMSAAYELQRAGYECNRPRGA